MEKKMYEIYDDLYHHSEEIWNQLYTKAHCDITDCSDCAYSSLCGAIINLKTQLLLNLIDLFYESED